ATAARGVPRDTGRRPVTLGVTEPFVTTFTVAGYAALLLALPFILWQAYAFILPAFAPGERRVALPLMALVPVLFAAGVAFGYYVALPRAVDFLQNFNDDAFDILIQARDYYRFVVLFIGVMGLVFQIPVGVLAITRTGLVSARGLWQRQGYVILGIAVVAAVATPTPDPVTMLVTMLPLVLLYWLSVGLAYIFQPRGPGIRGRWDEWWDDEPEEGGGPDDDDGPGQDGSSDGPDDDLGGESADGDGGRLATVGGDGADGMPPALRLGAPSAPLDEEPPADSVDVEEPVSSPGARGAPVEDVPVGAGPAADSPASRLERAAAVEEDEAATSLDVDGPRPSLS
ncbi:MAG: twin-arginine translocase subunit TatC, partial [Solirubrobacteraceae bacterium]|nr:twin-arginine translocase subunit TatC [Solirubrobacteraceae bacterium]